MGDLLEPAFRRAQDSAKEQLGTPLEKEPGQTVTFWLVRHDDFERAVAEGIRSYLDDPKVEGHLAFKLGSIMPPDSPHPIKLAPFILQSIGAKGVE